MITNPYSDLCSGISDDGLMKKSLKHSLTMQISALNISETELRNGSLLMSPGSLVSLDTLMAPIPQILRTLDHLNTNQDTI